MSNIEDGPPNIIYFFSGSFAFSFASFLSSFFSW
jgi:hypothetical protein